MARWLERRANWLKNNTSDDYEKIKSPGRPPNDDDSYGVKFIPLRCPKCKSRDIRCYSSHPPVRYHICNSCSHNFKSVEADDEK